MKEVNCKNCNKVVSKKSSDIKRTKNQYCSLLCVTEYKYKKSKDKYVECSECKEVKEASKEFFYENTKKLNGLSSLCKACCRHRQKTKGSVHKECDVCHNSFFAMANRKVSRFCDRICYGKWLSSNILGENHHQFKYGYEGKLKANRERALKIKIQKNHTPNEWYKLKEKFNFLCLCCKRREPEIKLTRDHIIPVSRGGSDEMDNIQPLCLSCNSRKHTYTINYKNLININL